MKPVPTYVLLQWEQGVNRSRSVPGELSSAGDLSRGGCFGGSFCSCLLGRVYASAATGTLIRQSSHSALHLFVEEVSPVIHHRLKVWSGNESTTGSGLEPLAFAITRSNRDLRH